MPREASIPIITLCPALRTGSTLATVRSVVEATPVVVGQGRVALAARIDEALGRRDCPASREYAQALE